MRFAFLSSFVFLYTHTVYFTHVLFTFTSFHTAHLFLVDSWILLHRFTFTRFCCLPLRYRHTTFLPPVWVTLFSSFRFAFPFTLLHVYVRLLLHSTTHTFYILLRLVVRLRSARYRYVLLRSHTYLVSFLRISSFLRSPPSYVYVRLRSFVYVTFHVFGYVWISFYHRRFVYFIFTYASFTHVRYRITFSHYAVHVYVYAHVPHVVTCVPAVRLRSLRTHRTHVTTRRTRSTFSWFHLVTTHAFCYVYARAFSFSCVAFAILQLSGFILRYRLHTRCVLRSLLLRFGFGLRSVTFVHFTFVYFTRLRSLSRLRVTRLPITFVRSFTFTPHHSFCGILFTSHRWFACTFYVFGRLFVYLTFNCCSFVYRFCYHFALHTHAHTVYVVRYRFVALLVVCSCVYTAFYVVRWRSLFAFCTHLLRSRFVCVAVVTSRSLRCTCPTFATYLVLVTFTFTFVYRFTFYILLPAPLHVWWFTTDFTCHFILPLPRSYGAFFTFHFFYICVVVVVYQWNLGISFSFSLIYHIIVTSTFPSFILFTSHVRCCVVFALHWHRHCAIICLLFPLHIVVHCLHSCSHLLYYTCLTHICCYVIWSTSIIPAIWFTHASLSAG